MLNRRYLRIKAMQNIFAFFQCRQSDYHLSLDLIREEFAPDLNSMEVQDPVKLTEDRKASTELFVKSFEKQRLVGADAFTEVQVKAAQEALTYFDKLVRQDMSHLRKSMVAEAEKIAERYLSFLLLLLELAEFAQNEREKRINLGRKSLHDDSNWIHNKAVALLASNKPLQIAAIKHLFFLI